MISRRSLLERLEPRVVLNGAPVAVADPWYSTNLNTALTVTSQGTTLLANDWDPEGTALCASVVAGPNHGALSNFGSDGTFTYTPTGGYMGFDQFSYRVSDGTDNSNIVSASIAVGGYLGPRTNQDGSSQDLALLAGGLEQVQPITPAVSLVYQSDTQANAIAVVETSLRPGLGVPSQIQAQLTFSGTAGTLYTYNTYGITSGDTLRFPLPANTAALATGHTQVGRWISEDPIEFAAGDVNVTRYVGNHVGNTTDPSGFKRKNGNGITIGDIAKKLPIDGNHDYIVIGGDGGHIWIGLIQMPPRGNGNGTTVGFRPSVPPRVLEPVPGVYGPEPGGFELARAYPIDPSDYMKVVKYINDWYALQNKGMIVRQYLPDEFNCGDAALQIIGFAGINLPEPETRGRIAKQMTMPDTILDQIKLDPRGYLFPNAK